MLFRSVGKNIKNAAVEVDDNTYKGQSFFSVQKKVFINADQVLGETQYMNTFYKNQWRSAIEKSGLRKEEILSGYERIKLDKEATLSQQLAWLRESGFSDVDFVYKYYHFAVMIGRRTS